MAKKFKDNISHDGDLFKAAKKRVLDYQHGSTGDRQATALALNYLEKSAPSLVTPPVLGGAPFFSSTQAEYLKDLKYHLHSHNLRSNSLIEHVGRSAKEGFAALRSIQRELVGLNAEVGEEEIKLLHNYSKVHLNLFTRGIDRPRQWADQSMLQDFKTGFSYREKYLLSVQPHAGLTLPVRHMEETPIRDVYIIDEATDVGDSLLALESSDPMNLTRKNKVFKHVIIRREYDHTSRKYKSRTTFDEYPYNCVSTMTLELEMPNLVMINYLKFEPIGNSTLTIASNGLTYKSEDGSEVSLNSVSVPGEVSTTLFFQPIHTKYIKIKFEQYGTVGRKDLVVGDRKIAAINKLLTGAGFDATLPSNSDHVIGRVYDFSIADMSVGLASFESKGIFRSGTSLNIDSPIGFDIKWAAEQLLPVETFDTYLRSIILPEGRVLYEFYCYLRLFGGGGSAKAAPIATEDARRKIVDQTKDTLILDSIVPIPDSYPIQMEYLKCIADDARVKLYPDLRWSADINCVEMACIACLKDSPASVPDSSLSFGGFAAQSQALRIEAVEAQGEEPFDPLDDPNVYTLTTLDYPREFIYGGQGAVTQEELNIRTVLEDAIVNAAGLSSTGVNAEYEIVYSAPSSEDLAFLLGWKYTEASPKLKQEIEANFQDYLLIDSGVFRSQGKSWNLYGTSTLYSVTDRLQASNTFSSALHGTKLMSLTVNDIFTAGSKTTISVSANAVKVPLTEKDTREQSPDDSAILMGMSMLNYAAHQLNNAVLAISSNESVAIDDDFLGQYPEIISHYNMYRASTEVNQVVWEKRVLGLGGNGPINAGSGKVTAYYKTRGATGPHGYFAAKAWDENDYSNASISKINSNLFVNFIVNPDDPEELFPPVLPDPSTFTMPTETLPAYLNSSTSQSAAVTMNMGYSGPQSSVELLLPNGGLISTLIPSGKLDCTPYIVIKMEKPHGYSVGDLICFKVTPYTTFPGEYKIARIFDEYSFGIKALDVPSLNLMSADQFDCVEVTPSAPANSGVIQPISGPSVGIQKYCCLKNAQEFCILNITKMNDPVEVYKDSQLQIIGRDYLISLDDKSTWLGSWALEAAFEEYHRRAKAGRFYIKFLKQDPGSIYWIKYRVKKNQELSNDGLIFLKNGRVTCNQSLRGASGTIDVIAIARTNSTNPHVTPILREYSLRVQEEPNVKRDSGKLGRKSVGTTQRNNTM